MAWGGEMLIDEQAEIRKEECKGKCNFNLKIVWKKIHCFAPIADINPDTTTRLPWRQHRC